MSSPPPTLLRPPSYHPVDWPVDDGKTRYVVINPMHIITLHDRTKTFAVRVVEKIKAFSERWFSHVLLMLFLMLYASLGALLFQWVEAPLETREKTSIIRTRELVIQSLLNARHRSEDEWTRLAYRRLKEYEGQVEQHFMSKAPANSEKTVWTFWGSLFYAGTIFTTIGYGNIVPATVAGQTITIIYAFIGIPFLLMVLADLGKLFTRWIKAVFFFVKQFCHTGKFRKARKIGRRATSVPVQYMSVAWNKMPYMVYQGKTKKRDSDIEPSEERDVEKGKEKQSNIEEKTKDEKMKDKKVKNKKNKDEKTKDEKSKDEKSKDEETKDEKERSKSKEKDTDQQKEKNANTKQMVLQQSEEEVDDEFNLPVSLAILLLLLYMMLGALLFTLWEDWTFFESFYFVFISMSTIGFGDYVPDHPMYMMATFIYLLFGLALTSMCINVVQEKLSATFEMAKLRIGTTIGLDASMIMEDDLYSEKSDTPDSRRRGSSAKSRRSSKSAQSSPPKSEDSDDGEKVLETTDSEQNKHDGLLKE